MEKIKTWTSVERVEILLRRNCKANVHFRRCEGVKVERRETMVT